MECCHHLGKLLCIRGRVDLFPPATRPSPGRRGGGGRRGRICRCSLRTGPRRRSLTVTTHPQWPAGSGDDDDQMPRGLTRILPPPPPPSPTDTSPQTHIVYCTHAVPMHTPKEDNIETDEQIYRQAKFFNGISCRYQIDFRRSSTDMEQMSSGLPAIFIASELN